MQGRPTWTNFRTGHLTICTLVPMRSVPHRVVKNADYLDWDAFARPLARHVSHRNGPQRDRRILTAEAKLRVAA